MSEKEKKIMQTFDILIPKLSASDKSYLLGLGEGMAIKLEKQENKVEEIIRLTGSVKSEAARKHAIELIDGIKK